MLKNLVDEYKDKSQDYRPTYALMRKVFRAAMASFQVFVCIYITTINSEPTGRACYHAKVCVHNAVEKCGIDSKGKLRRFIDSCDIKEYNCLKGTDFEKTLFEKCASLPSPKEDRKKQDKMKTKDNEEVDSQSQESSETTTKKSVGSKNQNNNSKKKKVKADKKEENLKVEKEDSAITDQEEGSVPQVNPDQANGVSGENVEKVKRGPERNNKNKNVSKSQSNVENDGTDSEENVKDNDNSQNNDNDEHDEEVHEDNKKD
ncbi:hypothetical protein RR48_07319 [Papilio machaon]|uniref:Uncharacterized protein n=1 Tax=Papilio machaon TaxID=76193 RepID=A0A194RK49_PAPMA|nr:hypothetical protein RR48_07319 [Papilio machaon]